MDILIYESGDGGDFELTSNSISLTSAVWNSVYLAMFGGNTEHTHTDEEEAAGFNEDYWQNDLFFSEDVNKIISETEHTLTHTVMNSQGLNDLAEAVNEDLSFLSEIATFDIEVEQIAIDKVSILITIDETQVSYIWDATLNEVIINNTI